MRKLLFVLGILLSFKAQAQQFSLYNTRTLYDAFENPSQKAFYADSSKKFAFNFFIPNTGLSGIFRGPAQAAFRTLAFNGAFSGKDIDPANRERNTFNGNLNTYLLMFRIFKSVKYNQEMGFSWQVKGESSFSDFTNQTFAILQDYGYFNNGATSGIFNNKGFAQTYHQIGFSYREDFNKRLGLGIKVSYLSGIAYNRLRIDSSSLRVRPAIDGYDLYLGGRIKSSFEYDDFNDIPLMPGFKNPGISLTASANYKLRGGWYLLANLKDLGFIHWGSQSVQYPLNHLITVENVHNGSNKTDYVFDEINHAISTSYIRKGFTSMINGKAELLINKDLDHYQPHLLLSKNLFFPGMDIALINTYKTEHFNFSLSTAYTYDKFALGGMLMYKTPNFELFGGSDNLFKTYYTTKGLILSNENVGRGYTAASFFLGFGLKFGRDMEHQANASTIPGFGRAEDDGGFFRKLFGKKQKPQ